MLCPPLLASFLTFLPATQLPTVPQGTEAAPLPPWAGDKTGSPGDGEWSTDGRVLMHTVEGQPPGSGTPCPRSAGSSATGLAVASSLQQLWVLDDLGVITTCQQSEPPTPLATFATGLVAKGNAAPTALAIDETNRLVFYAWTDFGTAQTTLFVAPMADPGAVLLSQRIAAPLGQRIGPVTNLAIEPGTQVLRLGDGRASLHVHYALRDHSIRLDAAVAGAPAASPADGQSCHALWNQ